MNEKMAEKFREWVISLTEGEMFVYWQGRIGMNISDYVAISPENVEDIGGIEAFKQILDSLERKAEEIKDIPIMYEGAKKCIERVRNKFNIV